MTKWYDNIWVICIAMILIYPVGWLLLIRSPRYGMTAKIVSTAIMLMLVYGYLNDKAAERSEVVIEPKKEIAAPKAEVPKPPAVTDLGLTFEQFKESYKANALEITGMPLDIDNAQLKPGTEQDVFRCDLSADVVIMGNVDKPNGKIKEAWVISNPRTQESAAEALIAYGLIMTALNPELTTEQRHQLMLELKLLNRIQELTKAKGEAVRGNTRYRTAMVEGGFFMFTASAKDL